MGSIIYLAQAIDKAKDTAYPEQVTKDIFQGLREREQKDLVSPLGGGGTIVFSPIRAFDVFGIQDNQGIDALVEINMTALRASTHMFCIYSGGESWGVPIEIREANLQRIPVILITNVPQDEFPMYLRHLMGAGYGAVVSSAKEAIEMLEMETIVL